MDGTVTRACPANFLRPDLGKQRCQRDETRTSVWSRVGEDEFPREEKFGRGEKKTNKKKKNRAIAREIGLKWRNKNTKARMNRAPRLCKTRVSLPPPPPSTTSTSKACGIFVGIFFSYRILRAFFLFRATWTIGQFLSIATMNLGFNPSVS